VIDAAALPVFRHDFISEISKIGTTISGSSIEFFFEKNFAFKAILKRLIIFSFLVRIRFISGTNTSKP